MSRLCPDRKGEIALHFTHSALGLKENKDYEENLRRDTI